MRDQALSYARRGWPVFPCKPNDKTPLTPNGFKNATTDEDIVEELWRSHPNANIGIATGEKSGIFVLDIDDKNGGGESLAKLRREYGEFQTYTVSTGGGGLHFYFKNPGPEYRNRANILPGIDVRGDGGYVIAPPSLHASGKSYRIVTDIPPQPVPQWLKDLLNQKRQESVTKVKENNGGSVGEGGRNEYLWRLAGSLRRTGMDAEAIEAALLAENEKVCIPPLDIFDVRGIVARIVAYAPGAVVKEKVNNDKHNTVAHISEYIDEMFEALKNETIRQGETTGITGIDELLGGGKRVGEITVWHAEAKTGKNALWHKMMHYCLENNLPVGYASRELSPHSEVLPNILSIELGKNVWAAFDDETITDEDCKKIRECCQRWPLYFAKGYGHFPFEDIKNWVQALMDRGVRYFWFDHLHYLIECPEEHAQASLLIKQLKTLAKEKNIHIDIIVQPNKLGVDGKLGLNSVKGGSAIIQAADNFIILERNIPENKNIMEVRLELARHRKCKPGSIYLEYNPQTTSFIEVQKIDPPPQATPAPRPAPIYEKML